MLKMISILIPSMFFTNMTLMPSILSLSLFMSFFSFNKSFTISSTPTMISEMENFNNVMISLSIFITMMMYLVSLKYKSNNLSPKSFSLTCNFLMMIVILFFMTDNMFFLYIFFELSLIPTIFLILKWGYQPERLQSSYYFIMYTICASLPLLYMFVYVYMNNMSPLLLSLYPMKTLLTNNFMSSVCLILAFLVKLPSWGFHLWLPKAHVEAPVSGSMILAGILLKLGGYGLMKITYMMKNYSYEVFNMFLSINIWGALMISFVCLCSMDMKILIAYSSVIHMNLLVLGILNKSTFGTFGAMLMMISHGISSPGMFAAANINYTKTMTRNLLMQKSISFNQPQMNMIWFLLISANMAAPPSLNLASELFIAMSVVKMWFMLALFLGLTLLMSGGYNLYMFSAQQGNKPITNMPFNSEYSSNYLAMLYQSILVFILLMAMKFFN